MNPLDRIAALEQALRELTEPAPKVSDGLALVARPKRKRKSRRPARAPRTPRLDDAAKHIVLCAWDLLGDGQHLRKDWFEAIELIDEDGLVPDLRGHSETLRALLAERAGLVIKWSARPIQRITNKRAG